MILLINKYKSNSYEKPIEPKAHEEHRDYKSNKEWSVKWIQENETDFPGGIRVMITSTNIANQLMTFMYRPPKDWSGCGYANHIMLNQTQSYYFEKVHKAYEFYKQFTNKEFYMNSIRNR